MMAVHSLLLSGIKKEDYVEMANGFRRAVFPGKMNGHIEKIVLSLGEGHHELFEVMIITDVGEQIAKYRSASNAKTVVFYPRTPVHNTEGSMLSSGPNTSQTDKLVHNGKVFADIQGLQSGEMIDYIELFYSE